MAINPNDITTVQVKDLPPSGFNLTDNIPHEVGEILSRGTLQQLADFIGDYLGASSGLAFNPETVVDGGTLPVTTINEWMLIGKGTFHNVGGQPDIVTTEELNAITSNGAYWSLAVEIPINVEFAGITQNIRSGYTDTTPSENAVFNALALKLNTADFIASIPIASETVSGLVELATSAETLAGIDNTRAVHPAGLNSVTEVKTGNSTGAIQGFAITNNGDGTVNIASGTAYLRATNDQYATLIKYIIPAVTNLALTDNTTNFVLVDYNGGSPALTVTTNSATINTETNSIACVISRVGTTLDYISLVGQNNDANAKIRVRFLNQEGIRRANGAVIGFVNRNLTLTAGTLFSGLIRINSPAFSTVSPDTFTYVYNNGSVWTRVIGQTQINNSQYNNAGTLATMPNNTFRADYIYLLPNNPSKLYAVYGDVTYANITTARTAPVPNSLPSELQVLGLLVGRQIIEKNAIAISEVSSSFSDVFSSTSVPEHNALAGLQGGSVNDYQHLTTAQLNKLNNSAFQNPIYYKGKDIEWFGDSYTQGTGATTIDNRFTSIVSRALGANEINHGVAGTTMEKRTPIDYMASPNMVDNVVNIPVKISSKAMLVFAFGLNDMGQTATAYSTANYKTDYQFVINNAISKGWLPNQILIIPAYYIGSAGYAAYATITGNPAPDVARHLAFIQAAKEVSEINGTMYFDIYQDQKKNDITLLVADNIHPNDAGHAYIANDVLQYLGADKLSVTSNVTFDVQDGFVPNIVKGNTLKNSLLYSTSGRVGIGTVSPSTTFHNNSTTTNVGLAITNSASGQASTDGGLLELDSSLNLNLYNKENGSFNIFTNNIKRATYLNNGRYLFNTATDDGINSFQINGNIASTGLGIGTPTINSQAPIHSHVSGSNYIYSQWSNGDSGQSFGDGCVVGIGNNMDFNIYNFENRPINLATNAIVRMILLETGVVQITNLAGTGARQVVADSSGNLSAGDISTSGSYSPTVTAGTNVTSATLSTASYTRLGNIITGIVAINMQATAINLLSEITITVPINRAGSVPNYYVGNGTYYTNTSFDAGNAFFSGSNVNTITLRFNSGPSVASAGNCVFSFQYDISK